MNRTQVPSPTNKNMAAEVSIMRNGSAESGIARAKRENGSIMERASEYSGVAMGSRESGVAIRSPESGFDMMRRGSY